MDSIGVESEPPDDFDAVVETDPTSRYIRFKQVLGKGSYKKVYKGFDKVEGIEVAWNKVEIEKDVESTEVHMLNSVKHKNIIKFYHYWIDDKNKTLNIITELFTSGSLRQFRNKHKKVDIKAVKGWARQILTGLNYLHTHTPPIIHRDLKCDNIFINGNHGEVKIGDLGFATMMHQSDAHTAVGTLEYMAPEVYDEDYNQLADIYSFGMCFLEMVTLEYPYSECSHKAQVFKKASSGVKPASLAKVKDPDVKRIIEKCLVPAAQRLSAKELLMDPFFQVNGGNNSSLDLPSTVSSKVGTSGNSSVLSEEAKNTRQMSPMEVDENGASSVVSFTESTIGKSGTLCLEIRMGKAGDDIKLSGKMDDANTVWLILHIVKPNRASKNIQFPFYLDSDTSLSVAGEMVDQVVDQDVTFIAELIDLYLTKLIPNWKPCVPLNHHLAALNGMKSSEYPDNSQVREERDVRSAVSCHRLNDAFNLSTLSSSIGESLQPTLEVPDDDVKLDEIMSRTDFAVRTEDEGSQISVITTLGSSDMKCSTRPCMSADSRDMECNGYDEMKKLAEALCGVDPDNDEELRRELEQIELQYEQAMKEIYMKKQEAIMALAAAAKKRLSQRNMFDPL